MGYAAELLQQNLSYTLFTLLTAVSCFCLGLLIGKRSHREATDYWMNHVQGALRAYSDQHRQYYDRRGSAHFAAPGGAVASLREAIHEALELLAGLPADTPTDPSNPQFLELVRIVESVFEGQKLHEVKARLTKAANIGQLIAAMNWVLEQLNHL